MTLRYLYKHIIQNIRVCSTQNSKQIHYCKCVLHLKRSEEKKQSSKPSISLDHVCSCICDIEDVVFIQLCNPYTWISIFMTSSCQICIWSSVNWFVSFICLSAETVVTQTLLWRVGRATSVYCRVMSREVQGCSAQNLAGPWFNLITSPAHSLMEYHSFLFRWCDTPKPKNYSTEGFVIQACVCFICGCGVMRNRALLVEQELQVSEYRQYPLPNRICSPLWRCYLSQVLKEQYRGCVLALLFLDWFALELIR